MDNMQKYKNSFKQSFNISDDSIIEGLEYKSITEWDSIGHMSLISELEDAFDIMIETDDVIEFSSFNKGIEILNKYNVELS